MLWARGLEQFCRILQRASQRKQRESGLQAGLKQDDSEHLRATHGRGAETERGFPGWFLSGWTAVPFAWGNSVIYFMAVKYLSLRVSFLTLGRWVSFLLQRSLMSSGQSRKLCWEVAGQARIFLGPQSMFFKLSLGEQFWMKDSFNNFISDPFLPTKLLFWE